MRTTLRTWTLAGVAALAGIGFVGEGRARAQNTYQNFPYQQGSLFYRYEGNQPARVATQAQQRRGLFGRRAVRTQPMVTQPQYQYQYRPVTPTQMVRPAAPGYYAAPNAGAYRAAVPNAGNYRVAAPTTANMAPNLRAAAPTTANMAPNAGNAASNAPTANPAANNPTTGANPAITNGGNSAPNLPSVPSTPDMPSAPGAPATPSAPDLPTPPAGNP